MKIATHQSLERAINLLKAFISNDKEMGTSELSEKLGLSNSTTCRILQVLRDNEFLQQNPQTKKYQLGQLAIEIGRTANQSYTAVLSTIAQPSIDYLRDVTKETTALEVLSGKSTVLAYRANGLQRIKVSLDVGERLPINAASGAKAIMAFLEPEVVDKFLNRNLEKYTPHTIVDIETYKKNLVDYRRKGVAFDFGEVDFDVYTLAAPIFNKDQKPVAAAVIAMPSYRMTDPVKTESIALVKKTAVTISSKLNS